MTEALDCLPVTLIIAPRKCEKCEKCQALIVRLQERFPGRLEYHEHTTDDEAADQFGVVLPPLLVVGDFIVAMGSVPEEDGLAQLIQRKLGSPA
jgi:hypothetical protein